MDLYLITTNLILFSINILNFITKKTVLVTSTINIPFFLEGICDNAKKYNFNDYSILVIGDVKTPVEAKQYCSKLSKKFKNELFYLDIKDQENYLEEFKDIFDFIPLNNNARKMIGTILAFVNGYLFDGIRGMLIIGILTQPATGIIVNMFLRFNPIIQYLIFGPIYIILTLYLMLN